MTDPIEQAITDNAVAPKKASVDGQSVEQHDLRDLVNVDRYLASKRATATKGLGAKLVKLSPGGTV